MGRSSPRNGRSTSPARAPTRRSGSWTRRGASLRPPILASAGAPWRFRYRSALGLVLDTTALISDLGDTTAADAAERAGSAELARLRALYAGGAGVSLRMLEAAQAEQAKAQAQAQAAASRFGLRWGPLAALPA